MIPGRLHLRFVVAAGCLVLTTVTASVWTLVALSRLSGVVTDTVEQSESVTAVTSRLAGALEREDDAVLLILARDDRAHRFWRPNGTSWTKLWQTCSAYWGQETSGARDAAAGGTFRQYREAANAVIAAGVERDALVKYHQTAIRCLRRVVALNHGDSRPHFDFAPTTVARARDEAVRARWAVLLITLAALAIAVAVAWHLTRAVLDRSGD